MGAQPYPSSCTGGTWQLGPLYTGASSCEECMTHIYVNCDHTCIGMGADPGGTPFCRFTGDSYECGCCCTGG